ncbi:MAG: hypothetical protein P4L73_08755 [Caulobacteraceae bacterium]|nr:hypothetical protein [Caulobacteraceae bacterium]
MAFWTAALIGSASQVAALVLTPASLAQPAAVRPIAVDCGAPAPAVGGRFEGTVLQVLDGRSLCVARGPHPSQWIRAELDDATDSSARSAVMAGLFAKHVVCVVVGRAAAGVTAHCTLDGVAAGAVIANPANRAAATAWR